MPSKTLETGFWQKEHGRFGVVLVAPPQPGYFPEGGVGLLDFAIIQAATKQVQARIATLDSSPLNSLPADIAGELKAKGEKVAAVTRVAQSELARNRASSVPQYDYSALARKLSVDTLVVVRIQPFGLGFARKYYGFIPLGPPQAHFVAEVVMVDNRDNQIFWSHPVDLRQNIVGSWDAPPDYSALADAYKAGLDAAKSQILSALK